MLQDKGLKARPGSLSLLPAWRSRQLRRREHSPSRWAKEELGVQWAKGETWSNVNLSFFFCLLWSFLV